VTPALDGSAVRDRGAQRYAQRVALVVIVALSLTGCSRAVDPEPSPTPTSEATTTPAPSPTTTDDAQAQWTAAIERTRTAGGVSADVEVEYRADDRVRSQHRILGLLDLTTGDADVTLTRTGRPDFRRLSLDGSLIDQVPGSGTWIRSRVDGQGLVGTDVRDVFNALSRLQAVQRIPSDADRTRISGTLPLADALRISGLSQEDISTLSRLGDSARIEVTADIDQAGFIIAWEQRITGETETLGSISVTTVARFSDYGQVVVVELPDGEILDAPGE
jgi:hypothetical protein